MPKRATILKASKANKNQPWRGRGTPQYFGSPDQHRPQFPGKKRLSNKKARKKAVKTLVDLLIEARRKRRS